MVVLVGVGVFLVAGSRGWTSSYVPAAAQATSVCGGTSMGPGRCRSVSVGVGLSLGLRAAPAARLACKVGSNVGEVGARH